MGNGFKKKKAASSGGNTDSETLFWEGSNL